MDAINCLNVVEFVRLDPGLDLSRQQIGDHADVIQWDHFAHCKASRTPHPQRFPSSQNQKRICLNGDGRSFGQAAPSLFLKHGCSLHQRRHEVFWNCVIISDDFLLPP
jgi:hypothetical protein